MVTSSYFYIAKSRLLHFVFSIISLRLSGPSVDAHTWSSSQGIRSCLNIV